MIDLVPHGVPAHDVPDRIKRFSLRGHSRGMSQSGELLLGQLGAVGDRDRKTVRWRFLEIEPKRQYASFGAARGEIPVAARLVFLPEPSDRVVCRHEEWPPLGPKRDGAGTNGAES